MLLADFFFVLVIALVIGGIFAYGLRRGGPWPGAAWFFVILFVGTWALGGFFRPFGPPMGDVHWAPYIVAALLIAMLLAAATPIRPPPASEQTREVEREGAAVAVGLGVFFWLILIVSILLIALRYAGFTGPP